MLDALDAPCLVYGIWIPPFVASQGKRTAGPWFLRLFEILEVLALVFFGAGVVSAVLAP